jgi:type IV pilus assembly protein PilM
VSLWKKDKSPSLAHKREIFVFKLFKSRPCSWLGLDISSASVNLVELSNKSGLLTVQAYACGAFPKQAVDLSVTKDSHVVSDRIVHLLETQPFSSKKVILAIPDALSINKIIQVSTELREQEIEEWIMFDVDKHLPYSLDEIYLDFQILGPSRHHVDKRDVLLVASKIQDVQQRIEVIERAGLAADVVEIESHAVTRAVAETQLLHHQKTVVMLDLREQSIGYFVFQGVTLAFLREEQFDEHDCYRISDEQRLLQIKRVLQFYFSTTNETPIDYFLLAGKWIENQALILLLQHHFNTPIQYVNPFINLALSNSIDSMIFSKNCSRLLVAYGLALRGRKEFEK